MNCPAISSASQAASGTSARRNGKPKAKSEHALILPIDSIFPSPENEKLYRPVDPEDPAIIALAASISRYGIRVPLVITLDNWILSGHRRYVAARLAGLTSVPCRIDPIRRTDDVDAFIVLLAEYNIQRVKTLDEQLREVVVAADPTEAYEALIEHRQSRQIQVFDTIEIRTGRPRAKISKAKWPFLDAAQKIIRDLQHYWPLSDRRIHYLLANDPPLVHASKPQSTYRLDSRSYNALTDLLTRARFEGEIAWEAIGDDTRPVATWLVHKNPQSFLKDAVDSFLKRY